MSSPLTRLFIAPLCLALPLIGCAAATPSEEDTGGDTGVDTEVPDTSDPIDTVDDTNTDTGSEPDVVDPFCGDGNLDDGEDCDNGTLNSDTEADACRTDCTLPRCGDGVVDAEERCDEGADNSDTAADACRTTCVPAACGDGVVDTIEACDDGDANSDTEADACRTDCDVAFCGDGVVDDGETCDDGVDNSDLSADACRTNCQPATCGDLVVDTDETCDGTNLNDLTCATLGEGFNGGDLSCGDACALDTSLCTVPASCGDGTLDDDETCDDGDANSDTEANACRTNCVPAFCGDGVIDTDEVCDDGLDNSNSHADACRTDCTEPYCGDGVVDTGEACDAGDGNSDTDPNTCRTSCAAASCGDGVVDAGETCDAGDSNSDTAPDVCRTDCTPAACGDGVIDSSEDCEGDDLGGATCVSEGFASGTLACDACGFVTTACIADPAPGVGDVIVTELMINPDASDDVLGEYFELYNASTTEQYELMGCSFVSGGASRTIEGRLAIPPQSYLTFARSDAPGFTPDYVYAGFILENGGASFELRCDGTTIDRVTYPDQSTVGGFSYSLDPDHLDSSENDVAANWCASRTTALIEGGDAGTPGVANDDCQFCGNGIIDGTELCDGDQLGEATCVNQGFVGGTLACGGACGSYDTSACNSPAANLFISEYVEGSSYNKAIEIHNASGAEVDLASCDVRVYHGGSTANTPIVLVGTLAADGEFVLCHSSAGADVPCDHESGDLDFNGDDAVALYCQDTLLDVVGQVGFDPGTAWVNGDHSTLNHTLRRQCDVTSGDRNADDAFDPASGWDVFAQDTFIGLGNHCSMVGPAPAAGEAIFTEIMHHGTTDWAELHNTTATDLDLGGCRLQSVHVDYTFPMPTPLLADATVALGVGSGFTPELPIDGFALDSDIDGLTLTCGGTVADEVVYDVAPVGAFPDLSVASLALNPDHFNATDNDSAASWCLGIANYDGDLRGTPGVANPACPTGVVGWTRLQWPAAIGGTSGPSLPQAVYGQFFIDGVTGTAGSGLTNLVVMQLGYAPFGDDPMTSDTYTWITAVENTDFTGPGSDVNSEASAVLPDTIAAGDYSYVFRFSYDGGVNWLYADTDGANSNADFDLLSAGLLETP